MKYGKGFAKVTSNKAILSVPSKDANRTEVEHVAKMLITLMENNPTWQGISAIQLKMPVRILAIRLNGNIIVMCNPTITKKRGFRLSAEGCLSVPYRYLLTRPSRVSIEYEDIKGLKLERNLNRNESRLFMHEYDHLEGKLISDSGRFRIRLVKNGYYEGE